MRLFIHDFGGYAFILQLSKSLAKRGHEVCHAYYGSHQTTPPGVQQIKTGDIPNLEIRPLELSEVLNKYNFYKRWRQETEYGYVASQAISEFKPDLVLSANTPLDAQKTILRDCKAAGIPFVFWIQDLLGLAAYKILRRKIPILGSLIGRHYIRMENKLLFQSDGIVTMGNEFLVTIGHPDKKPYTKPLYLVQNWAPLDQLPVTEKQNSWSKSQQLDNTFNFLYSGTLSMKHNPDYLLQLARTFKEESNVRVVVISNGLGADWLRQQKKNLNLPNLLILPYQPLSDLPMVLGAADVTVTLLEKDAGEFSVPSKVFSYMCAGRPLLMSVPASNYAAQIINNNNLGMTSHPGDTATLLSHARQLVEHPDLRSLMGQAARQHAERLFNIKEITNTFEELFAEVVR